MRLDPGFPPTFIFYVGGFSLNNATVSSKSIRVVLKIDKIVLRVM